MNTEERRVIKDGILDLAGYKSPCYILEDGTRVLSGRGMQDVLKIYDKVEEGKEKAGSRLREFLNQKALEPFIHAGKKLADEMDKFNPIICHKGGTIIHGYEATLLVDICKAILEMRKEARKKNKSLTTRQEIVASQCEMLLGTVAKVGIIALIDEATGYQYERERFELQKILELIVLKDKLFSEWKEMFPLGYYKDMFGVYGVSFTAENIRRKPIFIGLLTNELVYKNLPAGSFVLKEIKSRTPKTKGGYYKKNFHQSLTPLGRKALEEIINTVRTLAWVSGKDRNKFRRLVKERLQLEREIPYIDVEAMDDEKKETGFDKMLDACLNTPPLKKSEEVNIETLCQELNANELVKEKVLFIDSLFSPHVDKRTITYGCWVNYYREKERWLSVVIRQKSIWVYLKDNEITKDLEPYSEGNKNYRKINLQVKKEKKDYRNFFNLLNIYLEKIKG